MRHLRGRSQAVDMASERGEEQLCGDKCGGRREGWQGTCERREIE